MRKYVKKEDKNTSSINEYKKGKWIARYFHLYCDICGVKHPDVCVNELCEEEGFPDGDYCWNCQMSMREQGFIGKDKSIYFKKENHPKSDHDKLKTFLKWAKNFTRKNKLKLDGFWTYDSDYFSWGYLYELLKKKYIIINEDLGQNPEPEKIDVGKFEECEVVDFLKKLAAENRVQPWYYKGKGKIFEHDVLKRQGEIINKFKKTKKILVSKFQSKKESYLVHADWWGLYFLVLAALPGKSFHERLFQTDELYSLREFVEKERPKGVVLSYVTSDKACPIYDINLSPILDLFDIPELKYLKLLFVSKFEKKKRVEWVLAYSK